MNVPEALNAFPRENTLASGPFVVEAALEDGPVQSVGFDLRQDETSLYWSSLERQHSQPLKGTPRVEQDQLLFTREDGVAFVLRPLVPGDGVLLNFDDSEYLTDSPQDGQQALIELINQAYLSERSAPAAPEADQTDLTLALDANGRPVGLFKLSTSSFPLQRVDGSWRRLTFDVEDDVFGASDIDVLPAAVDAWDQGDLDAALAAGTDAHSTASPFKRLFLVTTSDDEDSQVLALFGERSRGRLYRRNERRWEPVDRREQTLEPSLDVTTGAISAWDDDNLSTLTTAEQFDLDGDTP